MPVPPALNREAAAAALLEMDFEERAATVTCGVYVLMRGEEVRRLHSWGCDVSYIAHRYRLTYAAVREMLGAEVQL